MAKIANGFVTSLLLLKIFIISNVALADVGMKKYDGPYPVNETWAEGSSGPYLQVNGVTIQPMANESSDVLIPLGAAPQTWTLLKEYTPWIDVNRFGFYRDLGVGHNQTLIFRGVDSQGHSDTSNLTSGTTLGLWLLNDCNGDSVYNGQDSYLFSQRSLTRGSGACEHQWFMVYDVRAYRGLNADYNFISPTEDYRMNGDYDYLIYIDDDHTVANFDHNDMILGVKCNRPPIVTCPGDTAFSVCNLNQVCIPGFTYSDPDGNIVSVTVSRGTLTGNTVCFTPTGSGNYPITLIARDSGGLADTCTANINITVNRPPVVSCPGQGNLTTCDINLTVCNLNVIGLPGFTYSDPDNNITSIIAIGGTFRGDSMFFTPVVGTNTLKLIVGDACGAADTCITTVGITLNSAPVVITPADTAITACNLNQLCLPGFSITDLDNNIVSTNVIGGTLNGGTVCLTPIVGVNTITIIATDACGKADTGITHINISLNTPPVVTSPPDTSLILCSLDQLCIPGFTVTDQDNNIISTHVTGGTLNGNSVCFTPIPGVNTITIIATDACGMADTGITHVNVSLNSPPVVSNPPDTSLLVCNLSQICLPGFSVIDPDNNIVSTNVTGGTLNGNTVCFTPVAGVNTITLISVDACGRADTGVTHVTVDLNRSPVVTSLPDTSLLVCNFNQICLPGFAVTDPDNNIVSTNVTGGTLNGNTVCLTPVAGVNTITIIAIDACGRADTGITHINVSPNSPPVATCPGNRTIVVSNLNSICISGFNCIDPDNNIASVIAVGGVLHGDSICFTPSLGINNIGIIGTDACGMADTCMTQITIVQALSLSLIGGNAPEFTEELADSFTVQISGGDPGSIAYSTSFIGHAGVPGRYSKTYVYPNIKNVMTFDYLGEFSSINSPFGYRIIVHDSYTADTLDLSLIVHDNNRQPTIAPIADTTIIIGQTLSFNVTATDLDLDNTLTLTKLSGPGNFSSTPGLPPVNGTFSWAPSSSDGGVHTVAFNVGDGRGGLASRSVQITVAQNQPPIIHILNLPVDSTYNFKEERPDSIIIVANDPENAQVTFAFTFPNESGYPSRFNSVTNGDSLILHMTFDFLGTWSNIDSPFEARIVASDPYGSSTAQFSIAVADSNRIPGITSINDTTIFAGSTLAFAVTGTDLDTDNILSLSKTSGPGAFTSLPGYPPVTGSYSWTTSNTDIGVHQVAFNASDGRGGNASDNVNITIIPTGINMTIIGGNPPVFTEEIADSFMVDLGGFDPASLTFVGAFTGHAGSPTRYSASLSGNNIKVKITFDYLGEFSSAHSPFAYRLIAHDNYSSDTLNVSLTVHDNNRAPEINVYPSYAFQIDHLTSFAVVVNDADTDNLLHLVKVSGPGTFTAANGAPPISSLYSWMPTDADLPNSPFTVVFAASDSAGGYDTSNVVITVLPDGVPVIQILYQPQVFHEGTLDSLVFTASDPDDDPIAGLSYKFLGPDSTFPGAGFTFANAIGKIRLTFNYNGQWSSTHSPFGLRLMAWSTTSTARIDSTHLDVPTTVLNTNRQPNLIVAGPHSIFAGNNVTLILTATDPDTDNLIALSAANLPSGSSFADNGVGNGIFGWTPSNSNVGTYEFRFFANDGVGASNSIDTVFWPLQVNQHDTGGPSSNGLLIGCPPTAPGTHVLVPVYLQTPDFYTGGFEVLVGTDPTVLTADSIIWSSRINYGSEYHYWNHHAEGPGTDRFVWIANINDGHYTPPAGPGDDVIFWIRYRVAAGEYLYGTNVPIQFIVNDYTDNTISDSSGYIFLRPPLLTLSDGCVNIANPSEYLGDPNMNCRLYEIADVVLVARRLIEGFVVWNEDDAMGDTPPGCGRHNSVNDPLQEASSDLNHNGYVDVADLVRFINIINGYADPPPGKIDPAGLYANISMSEISGSEVQITLNSNADIGGAMVIINHPGIELGEPAATNGMQIMSHDSDGALKVLIYSMEMNKIPAGTSTLFTLPKSSDGVLTFGEVSASDINGQLIPISERLEAPLPFTTSLEPNFPNPFNPSTKIKFSLADAGNTSLTIYDIAGRKVCDLAGGFMDAGCHEIIWNGRSSSNDEAASGVYFARLRHNEFDKIMKMSLIK